MNRLLLISALLAPLAACNPCGDGGPSECTDPMPLAQETYELQDLPCHDVDVPCWTNLRLELNETSAVLFYVDQQGESQQVVYDTEEL